MYRKYLFEAGLNVSPSFKVLVPIEGLKDLEKQDSHKYHIYFILAHDEYYFRKEKTKVLPEGIKTTLFYVTEDGEVDIDIPAMPLIVGDNAAAFNLTMSHPYDTLHIDFKPKFREAHPEITPKLAIPSQSFYQSYLYEQPIKDKYEVLYIGQAYGKEGSRDAFDRLSSHSTLQKILMQAKENYPTKHFYIFLYEINGSLGMLFDGRKQQYKKSLDESQAHMHEVICDLPKDKQIVNITEAALINYFKPPYNEKLVENFPNRNLKGYKQYFDLDYNALTVELDLDFDGMSDIEFYTETNSIASVFDFVRYSLHNEPDRLSMYDIFQPIRTE